MWARTTLEIDRVMSGAEERKARNEEKGSSVEEEHWRAWGKRLTFDLSGGSPSLFGAGRSAAPRGGGYLVRGPGWDLGSSDSLRACGGEVTKG